MRRAVAVAPVEPVTPCSLRIAGHCVIAGQTGPMAVASPGVDRARLAEAFAAETRAFVDKHPRSAELASASTALVAGVPMPWMRRWPGPFPITVDEAHGGRFVDVDGCEYVDLCLGDTGAMTGHAHPEVFAAVSAQLSRGATTMLPSRDASVAGSELERRFGLPKWQFALSATDANRFVLRFARALTGRRKILVHDWCYHGTVDETLVISLADGRTASRPGAIGPQVNPDLTTVVVPFNDVEAVERAVAKGDIACMLIEPALTNIGIVLPEPDYHARLREVLTRHGVLLIVDETHTICAGPGGCTREWGLDPDVFVIGKTIGSGIPVAAYGMTAEVAERIEALQRDEGIDVSGVGGTLAGNAVSLAAVRATLRHALSPADFVHSNALAEAWTNGVHDAYTARDLPWSVQRLGCRAEYWFCAPPRTGAEAAAAIDHELDAFMHLWALNRGILLTPFHNMALFTPFHREADVQLHTEVFTDALAAVC
jgi:glutamate-1-semialdehyde 2,1-aminomutase